MDSIEGVTAHPGVTAPIIGARNTEQLQASLDSVDVKVDEELWNRIANLSYAPALATDRNEEKTDHNYGLRT